jgi:pimeloyl-ACP methyl ester carboxylesterase
LLRLNCPGNVWGHVRNILFTFITAILVSAAVSLARLNEFLTGPAGPVAHRYEQPCPEELRLFALDYEPVCQTVKIQSDNAPDATLFVLYLRDQRYEEKQVPLLYLGGGFTQDSVPKSAAHFQFKLKNLRSVAEGQAMGRDLVFIDLRGAGRSSPRVVCASHAKAYRKYLEGEEDSVDEEQRLSCLRDFENLYGPFAHFTVSARVDDIVTIRKALNIEQWDVFATSYSTRLAAYLIQQDKRAVRSVVYDGVDIFLGSYVAARQKALDERLERADEYCPWPKGCKDKLSALLRELMEKADQEPFIFTPAEGKNIFMRGSYIRSIAFNLLYREQGDRYLFSFVHYLRREPTRKIQHDWLKIVFQRQYEKMLAMDGGGFLMSNFALCSDYEMGKSVEAKYGIYLTPETSLVSLKEACDVMQLIPTRLDFDSIRPVPALILSGSNDVITPPSHGAYLAEKINAKCHLVVEGAGHGVAFHNRPEVGEVMTAFWADPDGFDRAKVKSCQ